MNAEKKTKKQTHNFSCNRRTWLAKVHQHATPELARTWHFFQMIIMA
jgi:hypothetical protein